MGRDPQLSFADIAAFSSEPTLRETTFVVVDLETTGGRSTPGPDGRCDAITEIGAVKVRGGQIIGEFATLVDPGRDIPPKIVELTGITTAMIRDAPRIAAVLPMFLEFARGAILVAHNAGFDIGFLRSAAQQCGISWPSGPPALCTVRLARRVLSREEAPSVRLSALARLFGTATEPTHRALDDARATVEVLHALIERVGNQGVTTYSALRAYLPTVSTAQRGKRVLATALPRRPGVYLFRGPADEVLYVGTASDLRRRVLQYFTGADPRARMKEMVALAQRVDHVECAHPLEAGVRELRLLAAHAPPYNRRSRFPHRWWWVVLTDEPFPRLSVVRPADPNETAHAWRAILERTGGDGPTGLILTRQGVPVLEGTSSEGVARGGYVLGECGSADADVIIIATGSEVQLAVAAQTMLAAKGVRAAVVSMPCVEWFESQPQDYRDHVLPPDVSARVAVEAGIAQSWYRYVGDTGEIISIEHYGESADDKTLFREFGFTAEAVAAAAERVIDN